MDHNIFTHYFGEKNGENHGKMLDSCFVVTSDRRTICLYWDIQVRSNSYQGNLELGACFCIFELSTGSSSELALCSPSISQGIMPDLTQACLVDQVLQSVEKEVNLILFSPLHP
ncbi:hypothetical protein NQ317_016272 [Molorchus minor]|uniref:Uncharacterized protein n=1 Tax=Molorchus minor TaxID=1323400 RepID=A0ABQ9JXT8_9CUCU|nr:hypothetical protein NQ317_016272 [Molorchus minor]